MRRYELIGGDDGPYGPAFGPIIVFEVDLVEDGTGKFWQVVQLEQALEHDGQRIEFLTLSPRYAGDSLKKLRESGCTVGIGRVLPARIDDLRKGAVADNVEYWAVGTSKRIDI